MLGKKFDSLTIWGLVLLGELFWSPLLLTDLGASLSYLLTLVLLFEKSRSNFKLNVKLNLFSLPLVLYTTYQWNVWTAFYAFLVTPLFEYLLLPLTLVGVFVPLFSRDLALVLQLFSNFFSFLAKIPGTVVFGKPPLWLVVFWLGALFYIQISRKKMRYYWLLAGTYLLCFLVIHFPLKDEVVYFDVGQGDCTLIDRLTKNEVVLIDTGGKVHFKQKDWQKKRHEVTSGETIVANYLLSKGIAQIDRLYLTHQDADHVGNFPSLSKVIKIKKIIVPAGMEKLPSFKRRLAHSANRQQDVLPVTDKNSFNDPDLKLLHPFRAGQGTNADSLVLWLAFGDMQCLFTGDLDRTNELKVLAKYPNLHVDILKTGHHGSKTASDPTFVQKIKPQLAVISAGRNNRYGHPDPLTLKTLAHQKIPYLLTARDGMIKLKKEAGQVKVWYFKQISQ